jgi:hypothetical protein
MLLPLLFLLLSMEMPPGMRYEHQTLAGPLSIHIIEVEPQKVRLEAAHAAPYILSLEKVSSIAKRKGAFAAINGGFFRMTGDYAGTCSGILKIAGEWISSPRLERAAIGWKRKKISPLIDRVTWNSSVHLDDVSFSLDGINQPAAKDKIILYSSGFFPTAVTPRNSVDLRLDSSLTLLAINKNGNSSIPMQGYVLREKKPASA